MIKKLLALAAFTFSFAAEEAVNSKLSDGVDLSNYQELKKQETKIVFDANHSDVDGIYNYNYSPNAPADTQKSNIFLDGNFEKIYRYDSLYFDGDTLTEESDEVFNKIVKQIHKYTDDESREIVVSVLGFTQKVETQDEDLGTGTAYTNFFQSIGQRDDLDPDSASDEALNFMEIVYKKMLDDNISKEIIYKEK